MDKELERKIREEAEEYTPQSKNTAKYCVCRFTLDDVIDFAVKMIEKYGSDKKGT